MTIGTAFLLSWLQLHGYGAAQRNAVVHHAFVESRLNPAAVSRSGRHYGLFQLNGPRRAALFRYARERGRQWTDTVTQLEFMNLEWRARPASRAFFAASTAAAAITIFCRGYEQRAHC